MRSIQNTIIPQTLWAFTGGVLGILIATWFIGTFMVRKPVVEPVSASYGETFLNVGVAEDVGKLNVQASDTRTPYGKLQLTKGVQYTVSGDHYMLNRTPTEHGTIRIER